MNNAFLNAYKTESWRCPVRKIKSICRGIKWCYQRAAKGYCDYDSWGIDCWLTNTMPAILRQQAMETNGFPSRENFTFEDWQKTILHLAALFENSDTDTLLDKEGLVYPYNGTQEEKTEYLKFEKEYSKRATKNLHEALVLLEEYFHDLWW